MPRTARDNPGLPAERVGDVAIAATTQIGDQGLTIGRTAAVLAGLPRSVLATADEPPRPDTTLEGLAGLKTPFRPHG